MRTVICDIETESLKPSLIWVIACKEYPDGPVRVFKRPDENPEEFLQYAETVERWVGHNFLGFDLPVIANLVKGSSIHSKDVVDTLVVSRLLNYGIEGGHSLEAWGQRLNHPKPKLSDFSHLSEEMIDRVTGDVLLNEKLYHSWVRYIDDPKWESALWLEHQSALICKGMTETGCYFDIEGAIKLYKTVKDTVDKFLVDIHTSFPPRAVAIRDITPALTKGGTLHSKDFRWLPSPPDLTPYSADAPFTLIEFQTFNPGSPQQVVTRLNEAGWVPHEKTKGHIKFLRTHPSKRDPSKAEYYAKFGWTVGEENISTLPDTAPKAAHSLVEYLTMASRQRKLEEWFGVYNKDTHRIHGQFLPIGTWTHRMSHHAPNMGNNVSSDKPLGHEMRSLWKATPGRVLIGTDMDQAHLRILAHMIKDQSQIDAFAKGDKALFTDIHSLNAVTLGLDPRKGGRSTAKTFIYTFINGGRAPRIASLLKIDKSVAREYFKLFNEKYPGIVGLLEGLVVKDAARGYFEGIDGRKVVYDKEHGMLAGYLQNAEVIMMKRANIIWKETLTRQGVPFWQVNFIHDEWQTETIDDPVTIKTVKQVQLDSLREVGEIYGITCPISGESKSGYTWADTH